MDSRVKVLALAAALFAFWLAVGGPGAHAQIDNVNISAADITNVRGRPILASEEAHWSQSVGTSTVNIMGNSAAGGAAEASYAQTAAQMFRITNSHATQAVCLDIISRGASATTCNTACTAHTMTCGAGGGVATDGARLTSLMPPFTTTITGLDCLCAEADGAGTTVQATRITRSPQ